MSRVLWIGDAGISTGFGVVVHQLGDRLVDLGHEVHVLASNYRGDPYDTPMHLWPASPFDFSDTYGQRRIIEMLGRIDPDVVVILNDPHVISRLLFHNDFDPEQALRRYRPLITYTPVDGENLPDSFKVFARYSKVVTMSRFGQAQFPGSEMVYHGIDTKLFHPIDDGPITLSNGETVSTKLECKLAFGYDPMRTLILRVDRNGWRKDFGSTWKALLPIMRGHPEVDAHFHCAGNDMAGGPIMPELWSRDMDTADQFHLSATLQMPIDDLVALYNAADIFVSTSMGEGFGLTLGEAIACGLPVVAQACSSIPEVVGPGGALVTPGGYITSPSGQDLRLPVVDGFTQQIERLIQDPGLRAQLSRLGREHAKTFSWDGAALKFDNMITDIHQASLRQSAEAIASPA